MNKENPKKAIFIHPGGFPKIIFITRKMFDLGKWFFKAILLEDFEKGEIIGGRRYPAARVLPFTEENWKRCEEIIERRKKLEEDYQKLVKEARRNHGKRNKKKTG